MLLVWQESKCQGWDTLTLLGTSKKVGNAMTKLCALCGHSIKDGDEDSVGIVTTFKQLPSESTWAVEKPTRFTFINHASCDGVEGSDEDC